MAERVQFAKMNGLGNQILVVDMRGRDDSVTPEAAIALAADSSTAFDQIMAIHDARLQHTDAYIDILNFRRFKRPGLRQRHAMRGPGPVGGDRQAGLHVPDHRRHPQCPRTR